MSITFYPGFQDSQRRWVYVESIEGLNVCNRNGHDLALALGLIIDNGMLDPVPIGEFTNRCTGYLRRRLGRPDPAIASHEREQSDGPRWIEAGRGEGYLQLNVKRLLELARAGQAEGATHVYAA